jgi:hypothetical protein
MQKLNLIKKILITLLASYLIIGCSKTKEQIVDKCLTQANQTFPNHWTYKASHFQGCMIEGKYHFNDKHCDINKVDDALSGICYVKD